MNQSPHPTIVEFHLLQSFSPSCLNRDDTNTPKSCMFGGFRRGRNTRRSRNKNSRQIVGVTLRPTEKAAVLEDPPSAGDDR